MDDVSFAQGDVLFRPVNCFPANIKRVDNNTGELVVTHSETGHHHVIDVDVIDKEPKVIMYEDSENPLIAWLEVKRPATVKHMRSFDTHAPITLPEGRYEIRRQREHTPEGWRRVED